jgi:hypothetical protein
VIPAQRAPPTAAVSLRLMNHRRALIVTLVFLAGALAWWGAPALDAPAKASAVAATPAGEHASAANVSRGNADAANDSREVVADAADAALASCRARVQVVDAAGQPVAGAIVRFWPPRSLQTRDADWQRYEALADMETLLAATGTAATTDAAGLVEIVADPETPLRARRDGDVGEGNLPRHIDTALNDVRIALRRDITLRVEVVDTEGRPAVGRSVRADAACLTRARGLVHDHASLGRTDDAGVALLRHALHVLDIDEPVLAGELTLSIHHGDSDSEPTLLAKHRLAFAEVQKITNVRLTVSAGGTIVATVTDADGAPLGYRHLWLIDEHGALFDQAPDTRDDVYTFRGVPPGRRWRIEANDHWLMVGAPENSVVHFVGPRTNDDTVAVAMQVPVRFWDLEFRLVRRDGHPVADARVVVGHPALGGEQFLGESDGRGRVGGLWLRGQTTVVDLAPLTLSIGYPLIDRTNTIVVHNPVRPGGTDLGDIVVEPPVGEMLLARIEVRAGSKNVTHDAAVSVFSEGYEYRHWPTVAPIVDGVVELRGVPPPQRMLLDCSLAGFLRPTLPPLRIGEHRVVELEPAASLCVALRADGLPTSQLHARLVRLVDGHEDRGTIDDVMHTALWWRVVPGRYRLRIGFGDRVVHEVPALELAPGVNRWPADGTRLDLRDTVRIVRIATVPLTFADGPELLVVAGGATTLPDEFGKDLVHGGWVLAPPGAFDVLVRGGGFVPQRLVNPTGDITLPLQPCTWLDVEAATPWDALRVRIVSDAVTDALLRAFDVHPHDAAFERSDDDSLQFAPGTVLEITPVRGGEAGAPQRVVVGNDGTQRVELQ